jgi:hypothetical protein
MEASQDLSISRLYSRRWLGLASVLFVLALAVTAGAEVVAEPLDWLTYPDYALDSNLLAETKAIRGWCMVAGCGSLLNFGAVCWYILAGKVRP